MNQGNWAELDTLGKKLSSAINCTVRLSYDKPVFECNHGIRFMKHIVAETSSDNLRQYHDSEKRGRFELL